MPLTWCCEPGLQDVPPEGIPAAKPARKAARIDEKLVQAVSDLVTLCRWILFEPHTNDNDGVIQRHWDNLVEHTREASEGGQKHVKTWYLPLTRQRTRDVEVSLDCAPRSPTYDIATHYILTISSYDTYTTP